ncbi:ribosomal-processing cysteine protease Prp [Clostridium sp. BJN0001]|uniref:ribosomal-processing cysteine protease Prp n=1 Tax=Clostridium sp. BJN0001 TaxID=2930219 RepID=UPI001FD25691|nr:ribosomal-processing cysteine protease Prp [Clostridium sp. BJN0001]
MVTVVIKKHNHLIKGFEIKGHALDEHTKGDLYDLVCNSVSVLSQSVLIGCIDVLKLKPSYEMKDGYLKLDMENLKSEKAEVLLETFEKSIESTILGLDQELGYKKSSRYITLIDEEV